MDDFNKGSVVPIRPEIKELIDPSLRIEEDDLHLRYAAYRVHGEWFDLPAIAVQEIRAMGARD
jgi:hypothetical protein